MMRTAISHSADKPTGMPSASTTANRALTAIPHVDLDGDHRSIKARNLRPVRYDWTDPAQVKYKSSCRPQAADVFVEAPSDLIAAPLTFPQTIPCVVCNPRNTANSPGWWIAN